VKYKDKQWEKAKVLFEAGKSLREIEQETGIPRPTINRTSKKQGWQKGELRQLVASMANDRAIFETLETFQKEVVSELVDTESRRLINFKKQRDRIAELAFERIAKELPICEVQHIKSLVEAADKNCIMAEIAPRGGNINVTQATQVNESRNGEHGFEIRFVDVKGGSETSLP
jgi:hypothetical protein